ncbi:MAG: hypothetical protein ACR2I2_15670 [Bryobacteraceae bacterium]
MIRIGALLLLFAADPVFDADRVIGIADSPSERLSPAASIAPGAPPVLSFRHFDAAGRGRFGDLGLMADDAGH